MSVKDKATKLKIINDPIHGSIMYTSIEHEIISSYVFNRLHDVLQNSLVFRVFPGDRISRFSHSIGVMHLSSQILFHALANTDEATISSFSKKIEDFINKYLEILREDSKIVALGGSEVYCLNKNTKEQFTNILDKILGSEVVLNHYIPSSVGNENKPYLLLALQSLRIASLLHDIGHLPLSHVFEYVLDYIGGNFISDVYKNFKELFSIELRPHEKLSIIIALQLLGNKYKDQIKRIKDRNRCPSLEEYIKSAIYSVLAFSSSIIILGSKGNNAISSIFNYLHNNLNKLDINYKDLQSNITIFSHTLHEILDNEVDSDKMDYVERASLYSGVKMMFNKDRIIMTYRLIYDNDQNKFHIVPSAKALHEIEQLHKSIFRFYRNIIGHHRVMLLEKIIVEILIKLYELYKYNNDDIKDYIKRNYIQKINDLLNFCSQKKFREALALLFVLDDMWMFSILKYTYMYILRKKIQNNQLNKIELELEILLKELFENAKELRPLWKHRSEYWQFLRKYMEVKSIDELQDFNERLRLNIVNDKDILVMQNCITNCIKSKHNSKSYNIYTKIFIQSLPQILRLPKLKGNYKLWTYDNNDNIKLVKISDLSYLHELQNKEELTHIQLYLYYHKDLNKRYVEECTEKCIKKMFKK